MKCYWKRYGFVIALAVAATFLFACSGPVTTGTSIAEPTSQATVTETTRIRPTVTETVQPLVVSDTEGVLLTYMGSPAPIVAYNRDSGELMVYCFANGSSHVPYVINQGIPKDGSEHKVYIPDYDQTATVFFDVSKGVWRVFMSPIGTASSKETEWAVYIDRWGITDRSDDLRRETTPGVPSRYYSVESGVFYLFSEGSLTIAADMNGDDVTEMFYVFSGNEGTAETMDYTVRISGEEVYRIEDVLLFSGAYITDVNVGDSYKEIVLEYEDGSGQPVSEIFRYDGSSVRTKVLVGSVDCSGDGWVYLRGKDIGATVGETVIYDVDTRFIFREI